jgi:two-component system response regulator PilR (NtrC family)
MDEDTSNTLPKDQLEDYLVEKERKAIIAALEKTRWNKTAAAKLLGISFRQLRYRLKKLDLE